MIALPRYVLDASVALKWHLDDEEHSDRALAVLSDYQEGRIDLVSPANILYEVPGAIRTAVSRKRLTPSEGQAAIAAFLDLAIRTVDGTSLSFQAYSLALLHNCSYYDGLYLALSATIGSPLLYADERLRRAIEGQFASTVFITDYS